jgi:hypothetical protein
VRNSLDMSAHIRNIHNFSENLKICMPSIFKYSGRQMRAVRRKKHVVPNIPVSETKFL